MAAARVLPWAASPSEASRHGRALAEINCREGRNESNRGTGPQAIWPVLVRIGCRSRGDGLLLGLMNCRSRMVLGAVLGRDARRRV